MKKVVTIGGGTGSFSVLSGIKNIPNIEISAIVTMADSGGGSGRLRKELDVLPPGDVRQCLLALSENTETLSKLMNYRFTEHSLSGQNFGNIFLATLEKVTGDFSEGVKVASEILNVKGRVLPVTKDNSELVLEFIDGDILDGEHEIDISDLQKKEVSKLSYKNPVQIDPEARKAIIEADYILLCPGDFYTSLAPNFLVDGFKNAVNESKAKIILIANLVNKENHTEDWKLSDYVSKIEKYIGKRADVILVNNGELDEWQVEQYNLNERKDLKIEDDLSDSRVIRKALVSHEFYNNSLGDNVPRNYIRHNSEKLSDEIEKIIHHTKYIFDFDDVLLHTTSKMKKAIESKPGHLGVNKNIVNKRNSKNHFILKEAIPDISEKDRIYEEIMVNCSSFINQDLVGIIKNLGRENCYMVTFGNKDYQMEKIERAGIAHLFSEIIVVDKEDKKEVVEEICRKHEDQRVIFVDDKLKNLENLDMKHYPNLRTILFDSNGVTKFMEEVQMMS